MAYEFSITCLVKTVGPKTNNELRKIISDAIADSIEIRDLCYVDSFVSDAEEDPKTLFDELNELSKKDMKKNPYIPK